MNAATTFGGRHGRFTRDADRHMAVAREWEQLVEQARNVEGFADFLRPPRLETLLPAADGGPVVILNVSRWRCDALIVTVSGVEVVGLPGLAQPDVVEKVRAYLEAVEVRQEVVPRSDPPGRARRDINVTASGTDVDAVLDDVLGWMWDAFAAEILERLGATMTPAGVWPRVWWCPTGPLALLPIHAAGHHRSDGKAVLDRVISSYTPTLRALVDARSDAGTPDPATQRMLVVGLPETLDHKELPRVREERKAIARLFGDRCTSLNGADATRNSVLAELLGHSWVHFACHGEQHIDDPSRGSLILHDGALTVTDIGAQRYRGEFAYLSSCKSAVGGVELPDESIWKTGVRLAVVPRADLDAIGGDSLVVIDELDPPVQGSLGGTAHKSPRGRPVPVSPWSSIAQVVLDDRDLTWRVLTRQEEIAAAVGDEGLAPAWPMAMAVMGDPEIAVQVESEAMHVLESSVPPHLVDSPALERQWRELLVERFLGKTTREAFEQIDAPRGRGKTAPRELAVVVYLERALHDPQWLLRPGGAPVPALGSALGPAWPRLVHEALQVTRTELDVAEGHDASLNTATIALRRLDLITRVGLDEDVTPETDEVADQVLARVVRRVLLVTELSSRLVARAGVLDPRTTEVIRRHVAGPLLESPEPLGARLPMTVLGWLHGGVAPSPPTAEELAAGYIDPLAAEYTAQLLALTADPAAYRPAGLLLAVQAAWNGDPTPLQQLARGPVFTARDLIAVLRRFDAIVLAPVLRPALLRLPGGEDLSVLVGMVLGAEQQFADPNRFAAYEPVLEAARLRYSADLWWRPPSIEAAIECVRTLLRTAGQLSVAELAALAPEASLFLAGAYLAEIILWPYDDQGREQVAAMVAPLLRADQRFGEQVASGISTAVDNGVLNEEWLVYAALCGSSVTSGPLASPSLRGLGRTCVWADGRSSPILDLVVRRRVAGHEITDVPAVWGKVLAMIHRAIQDRTTDPREAEKQVADYERAAESWWRQVGYSGDLGGSRGMPWLRRG